MEAHLGVLETYSGDVETHQVAMETQFYKLTVGLKFNRTSASFSSDMRRNGATISEMPKHSSLSMKISKTELVIKQLNVLTYRRITSILG